MIEEHVRLCLGTKSRPDYLVALKTYHHDVILAVWEAFNIGP